jgi:nicotinamidase-related amidase
MSDRSQGGPHVDKADQAAHLLLIDPQNDFCDLPSGYGGPPALPVTGAHADMLRVASMIDRIGHRIDAITVTLDSHLSVAIERPAFWVDRSGRMPEPFTTITAAMVRDGQYAPRRPELIQHACDYLEALEAQGKYTLMIWPVHCVLGTWGHAVHTDVQASILRWENRGGTPALRIPKGMNPMTEQYSAVRAEVPVAADASTQSNTLLLSSLARSKGLILVAGEASSHCVRATVEDLVELMPELVNRMVLLTDCMSPVSGFEAQHRSFLDEMAVRGGRLMTSDRIDEILGHN